MKKSAKYIELNEILDNFETYKAVFYEYLRAVEKIKMVEKEAMNGGTCKSIKQWFPPINPISPLKTAEFMAIHRYGFINYSYYKKSPSTAFFSQLEKLPKLLHILKLPENQRTYQKIYESVKKTKYESVLIDLLDDLEERASEDTMNLLENIIEWGDKVIERELQIDSDEVEPLNLFNQSIKAIKLNRLLLRLVTTRKPVKLFKETTRNTFPLLFSLATFYSRELVNLRTFN